MQIATWNLNNRVGKVRFRPEAASAAIALSADVLVFNEYYPQKHETEFSDILRRAGWSHQAMSRYTGEKANRVLIASRLALRPLEIPLPDFDRQFPSNLVCVETATTGIAIIGVRVPWYEKKDIGLVINAWDWLEATGATLANKPAIILGDLNVALNSTRARGGEHFRRILQAGWQRATPKDAHSFFGAHGQNSEIDHILVTQRCHLNNPHYVIKLDGHLFAGGTEALSDHAALLADVTVRDSQ